MPPWDSSSRLQGLHRHNFGSTTVPFSEPRMASKEKGGDKRMGKRRVRGGRCWEVVPALLGPATDPHRRWPHSFSLVHRHYLFLKSVYNIYIYLYSVYIYIYIYIYLYGLCTSIAQASCSHPCSCLINDSGSSSLHFLMCSHGTWCRSEDWWVSPSSVRQGTPPQPRFVPSVEFPMQQHLP